MYKRQINNPENYDAARYSVEYRLSVTHADGETEHFSEEDLKKYQINVLDVYKRQRQARFTIY